MIGQLLRIPHLITGARIRSITLNAAGTLGYKRDKVKNSVWETQRLDKRIHAAR